MERSAQIRNRRASRAATRPEPRTPGVSIQASLGGPRCGDEINGGLRHTREEPQRVARFRRRVDDKAVWSEGSDASGLEVERKIHQDLLSGRIVSLKDLVTGARDIHNRTALGIPARSDRARIPQTVEREVLRTIAIDREDV